MNAEEELDVMQTAAAIAASTGWSLEEAAASVVRARAEVRVVVRDRMTVTQFFMVLAMGVVLGAALTLAAVYA